MDIDRLSSYLLLLCESGDEEALDIFLKNQGLAIQLARRAAEGFAHRSKGTLGAYDEDDFMQEAMLALYRAAQEFEPERGLQFSTFAYRAVQNALRTLVKKGLATKRSVVGTDLDKPVSDDEDASSDTYLDTVSYDDQGDPLAKKDSNTSLRAAIAYATEGDPVAADIMTDLMDNGENFNYRHAEKKYGLFKMQILRIIKKSIEKMRQYFAQRGITGFDHHGNLLDQRHVRKGEHAAPGLKYQKRGPWQKYREVPAEVALESIREFFSRADLLFS